MGPRFLNVNFTIKDWIEESIDLGLLHRFCHQLSYPTHQWAQIWPGLPFAADIPVKLSCCSSHLSPDSVEMGFGFSKPISVCFDSDSIFLLSKTYKKKKKKRTLLWQELLMFLHLEYLAELLLQLEKESSKIDRDICTADCWLCFKSGSWPSNTLLSRIRDNLKGTVFFTDSVVSISTKHQVSISLINMLSRLAK